MRLQRDKFFKLGLVLVIILAIILISEHNLNERRIDNLTNAIVGYGEIANSTRNDNYVSVENRLRIINNAEIQIDEIESMLLEIGIEDRYDVLAKIELAKLRIRLARAEAIN